MLKRLATVARLEQLCRYCCGRPGREQGRQDTSGGHRAFVPAAPAHALNHALKSGVSEENRMRTRRGWASSAPTTLPKISPSGLSSAGDADTVIFRLLKTAGAGSDS